MKIDEHDSLEKYCPKLGHALTFQYCRCESNKLPCSRIADCWQEKLPVREFLDSNYSLEEKKFIFRPAKNKLLSLFEIIQKSQAK